MVILNCPQLTERQSEQGKELQFPAAMRQDLLPLHMRWQQAVYCQRTIQCLLLQCQATAEAVRR